MLRLDPTADVRKGEVYGELHGCIRGMTIRREDDGVSISMRVNVVRSQWGIT
jgi:hypothetical protein